VTEQRYRAVLEVQAGVPVIEVAERFGVSRQAVHRWVRWYRDEGLDGLSDRSHRPHAHPAQTSLEVEAAICELRRNHPRWGQRRLQFELGRNGCPGPIPGLTTIYRVLVRHGLIQPVSRRRRREDYQRWQREVPMELWQLDIAGGIQLADGGEAKVVTGVDDHSRFCVIATVVRTATGRAVCLAFVEALQRFGIPDEVLSDNGKQFTGRFNQPRSAEVMFERICRENGIVARHTKPRSPTTTGKVERFQGRHAAAQPAQPTNTLRAGTHPRRPTRRTTTPTSSRTRPSRTSGQQPRRHNHCTATHSHRNRPRWTNPDRRVRRPYLPHLRRRPAAGRDRPHDHQTHRPIQGRKPEPPRQRHPAQGSAIWH